MSFVTELRRRSVFRVAAAYLGVGWLLTEVLTTILPTLGAPSWVSRAVILIFAFGFIPAVVVLIVLVFFSSAQRISDDAFSPVGMGDAASVAVLPFVNLSADSDNEDFSDGLTETLLHLLAQIPDLKVAARTSSFAFNKGQNLSIREIAAALKVAHVLEGSVQRAGDSVRITAELIRARDGFQIWSEYYDRELDDIFVIQDEIAEKVGYALTQSLLGDSAEHRFADLTTTNSDAYDLYKQARRECATYSYGGLTAAADLLKGALFVDPESVDTRTELAMGYCLATDTTFNDRVNRIHINRGIHHEKPGKKSSVARLTSSTPNVWH